MAKYDILGFIVACVMVLGPLASGPRYVLDTTPATVTQSVPQ